MHALTHLPALTLLSSLAPSPSRGVPAAAAAANPAAAASTNPYLQSMYSAAGLSPYAAAMQGRTHEDSIKTLTEKFFQSA